MRIPDGFQTDSRWEVWRRVVGFQFARSKKEEQRRNGLGPYPSSTPYSDVLVRTNHAAKPGEAGYGYV